MPKINKDEILGYKADGDYYCPTCAKNRGKDADVKHTDLLTEETMNENEVYYCKDCEKRINQDN